MITITNTSPHLGPTGTHTYEVRINNQLIVEFKHRREDGLGMCLLEASKSVERNKWEKLKKMIEQK